jgi:hypothetical protein
LLARLDASQFIPGAQAIVLSEHVTYWDHLGWRDPFSLDEMTERQQGYALRFGLDGPSTPQVVVDGAEQLVGSDSQALVRAVTHAAQVVKPEISIRNALWTKDALAFSVHAASGEDIKQGATLVAVLAEDSAQSAVGRGENAGHTLRHVAVVRILKNLGKNATDGRPLRLQQSDAIKSGKGEPTHPMRLVVFLIDPSSGHVLAVAEQAVTR